MSFTVACECGQTIPVAATQCGAQVNCACGKSLLVPRLSELRQSAGLEAFAVSPFDRVRELSRAGALPLERACVSCGAETTSTWECLVECERTSAKQAGYWQAFVLMLFRPLGILFALSLDDEDVPVLGRDLAVKTPIRLCPACFQRLRPARRACGELLRRTDVYRRLLEEYPHATLQWERTLKA